MPTYSYPLELPFTRRHYRATLTATTIAGLVESVFTGQQQVHVSSGQYWSLEITLPRMGGSKAGRIEAAIWDSWMLKLDGPRGTFLCGNPDEVTLGAPGGSPVVSGAHTAGVRSLTTVGWEPTPYLTADSTEVTADSTLFTADMYWQHLLYAGDFIQIGTGLKSRLYKVLNNVIVEDEDTGSTMEQIDIWPALRFDAPDGTPIIYTNPRGLFRLAKNQFDLGTERGLVRDSITISAREVL